MAVPTDLISSAISSRCLAADFLPPTLNGFRDIYIRNGSSIPVGSTLTFTYNGETGSYVVTNYVGAEGSTYIYTVQNTGGGHTSLVVAGAVGACDVPIEVQSDVDVCALAATTIIKSLSGCYNGSGRGLTPTGPNQTIVSNDNNEFVLKETINVDCCVKTKGALKFTAGESCISTDSVELEDENADTCFFEAVQEALAANNILSVKIGGYQYIILDFDVGTNIITIQPANTDVFDDGPIVELPAGTSICLGDCCNTCIDGDQTTQTNFVGPGGDATKYSTFAFENPGVIPYDDTVDSHYLIGRTPDGLLGVLHLEAGYHLTTPQPLPKHADPLLIRQKICNTSDRGCTQRVEIAYNYELQFLQVPAGLRIHWAFGSLIGHSATLEDGVTPNPFAYAGTQSGASGCFEGPSFTDATITPGTLLGYGDEAEVKVYPHIQGEFTDRAIVRNCDCLNSIVWLHVLIQRLAGFVGDGDILTNIVIRRDIKKVNTNQIAYPSNSNTLEGFN